jgi:hypothetical protein
MPFPQPFTDFQVQVLLERILRRPLWKVRREGLVYFVWTTAHEKPVQVTHQELGGSMLNGNIRPTQELQKRLLEFQGTGIPDKDGNDITGRVTPRPEPGKAGVGSLFRSIFGKKAEGGNNGSGA